MNRRSSGSLLLSKAITGFIQYKAAEGLSPTTLTSYEHDLKLWLEYMTDMPVNWIKTPKVRDYFVWLRTDYEPRRITGDHQALAPKTIRNFYISLSAFFTWASTEFDLPNPIKAIPAPKFEEPPIEPFTKDEVEALLKACESSKEVQPSNRRKFTMRRATGRRDQAIILTLLDTGLRASELSRLEGRRCRSQNRQSSDQAWSRRRRERRQGPHGVSGQSRPPCRVAVSGRARGW